MKKLVIIFTLFIIILSIFSSVLGVLSYHNMSFEKFVTARGERIEILTNGIYKFNSESWVMGGIPWDFVRLIFGIPLLIISFILYLKNSLRGTLLFIGVLASFFYQYLLWTMGWALNQLLLVYIINYSLSLITLILVIRTINVKLIKKTILDKFPVKAVSAFSFAVGGMLLLKCFSEIIPTILTNSFPAISVGQYTLFDQAIDLGLLVPFSIMAGILLLKHNIFGYILSTISLILFINIGLSVIMGAIALGLSTGNIPIQGITVFSVLLIIAIMILGSVVKNIRVGMLKK